MKNKIKDFFEKKPNAKIKVKELAKKLEANTPQQYDELKNTE